MRTNVAVHPDPIFTHEGAKAIRIDPVKQLRRSVMSCMLWESEYYEDGVSIGTRIQAEIAEVLKLKNGAVTIASLAFEARTRFKLRHVPLWLIIGLIRAQTPEAKVAVYGAICTVIQRPDEIAELLAMYWKDKRQPLTRAMKLGLARVFCKFDEYSLSKYANRDAGISIRDVMFLVHPKPKDEAQSALWKKLADKELTAPGTWEARLSAGENKKTVFESLIAEKQLGALALLRNLRGMIEAGVPLDTIRAALETMKTERVLPFRFISAARYAPTLEPELEEAMTRCVADMPKLSGRTVLVVDNSGSMYMAKISEKSELNRADAACALAMLLREICANVQVVVFSTAPVAVPPRRGFALRDIMQSATEHGSTNTQIALQHAALIGYDRCIVITDEQSHQTIGPPLPGTKGYFINVASNKNGIGYGAWTHVDGFSESIADYILQAESENES